MKTSWLLILLMYGCVNDRHKDVGDITYVIDFDDANFELCNQHNVKQYYVRHSKDTPPSYKGEKRAIEKSILDSYNYPNDTTQNGNITIRFIVNCKGKSGRFRIEQMDFEYKPMEFDSLVSNQLLSAVKSLDGWIPRKRKDKAFDFYQYLTFKIENGQIVKIMP